MVGTLLTKYNEEFKSVETFSCWYRLSFFMAICFRKLQKYKRRYTGNATDAIAQPSRGTKRRGDKAQTMTKQTPHMKLLTHKELQQRKLP